MNSRLTARIGLSLAVFTFAAMAAAKDTLELRNEVFQEIETKDDAGKARIERVPAAKAVPGSDVIYVITYRNVGTQPAADVVVSNPVPAQLAYKGDTAFARSGALEVSVDGGASYGALDALRVTAADGTRRAAQASDVTHVRWKVKGAVRPGEQGSVSYRAVIR